MSSRNWERVVAAGRAGVVQRYEGGSWTIELLDDDLMLTGVWGSGPTDVYAVGPARLSVAPQVWRFDGAGWTSQDAPEGAGRLWAVGGAGNDVYVAGDAGRIWQKEGAAWIPLVEPRSGTLRAIWASGETVVAVGGGAGAAIIRHFDGEEWLDPELPYNGTLLTVWGASPHEIYAGGFATTESGLEELFFRYDGSEWSAVPGPGGYAVSSGRTGCVDSSTQRVGEATIRG